MVSTNPGIGVGAAGASSEEQASKTAVAIIKANTRTFRLSIVPPTIYFTCFLKEV
jgi:hypothetical protein